MPRGTGKTAPAGDTPGTPAPRRRRFRVVKGIAKVLGWIVLSVLALLLLVFVFLQTAPGKDVLKGIVLDTLNDTFRGRLEVDEIGGFLPFDVELVGVRAYDPDGVLVMTVDRVAADFHPLELLQTTVHLSEVRVSEPRLEVFDAAGRFALLRTFEPRTPTIDDTESPWIVRFEGLLLDGGHIVGLLPEQDVALRDLGLDLSLAIGPKGIEWPHVMLSGVPVGTSPIVGAFATDGPEPGRLTVTTRGALEGPILRLEDLDIDAGEHRVALRGTFDLERLSGAFDIVDLRVALDRLPEPIRSQVVGPELASDAAPLLVAGSGRLSLDDAGEASVDLGLSTAYGYAAVRAGADLRAPGVEGLVLGDWALALDVADLAPGPLVSERIPAEARGARADLRIEGSGHGLPLDPGGALRLNVTIDERAPNAGRLEVALRRAEDAQVDGAPRFRSEIVAQMLDLQPWLGMGGEPDLDGRIHVFYAEADVALPEVGLPRAAVTASFDANASGYLHAADRTLAAPDLTGSVALQWPGSGTPTGRVELRGLDLGFDLGSVRVVDLGFDVRTRDDGAPQVEGTLRVEGARWDEMRVATLELPLDLTLEHIDSGRPVPSGRVAWRATGIDLGAQTIASTSGDAKVTPERDGLRVRAAVRTGAVDLGRALGAGARASDLAIDALLRPSETGAPAGGPMTVYLDGTISEPRQGERRVAEVAFDDVVIELPRGPGGPIEVRGVTRLTEVRAPEGRVASAVVDADMVIDPGGAGPAGSAKVEVGALTLADGRRIDRAVVDAEARGDGTIAFTGRVEKRRVAAAGEKKGDDDDKDRRGVTAKLSGIATLPGPRRALAVDVSSLRLERPGEPDDFLVASDIRYAAGGWVSLADLVVRPRPTGGSLALHGRFRPFDGTVEVEVAALSMSIPTWVAFVDEALAWADMPPLKGIPDELGGEVNLALEVGGSLAAPVAKVSFSLDEPRWGDRTGEGVRAELRIDQEGVHLLAAASWHEGGDLSAEATLPATLSLSPLGLAWDDAGALRMALSFDETEIDELFAWGDALASAGLPTSARAREKSGIDELSGAMRLDFLVEGTPAEPTMRLDFVGAPIDFGDWEDGSVVMTGSASGDATSFRLLVANASDEVQAQIDVQLPFDIVRTMRQPEPVEWMREQMRDEEFAVELDLPRVLLSETPLGAFLPPSIADLELYADLALHGKLQEPEIQGVVALSPSELNPFGLGYRLDFDTHEDVVDIGISAARPTGDPLVDGRLSVPNLGSILQQPSTAVPELLEDPDFMLELQSADIASFDFWELSPALGDLAVQLFPDGRVMVDVSGHGAPEGLTLSLMTRVRTVTPAGVTPPSQADSSELRRNAADDVRVAVLVSPDAVRVDLAMIQDARSVTPFLAIQASAEVGPRQLLSPPGGKPLKLGAIPIEGRIVAGDFRLEGFASAFRYVLGTSGGQLTGEVLVSGTLGQPRFEQSLVAQFQPIVVAPLGLSHDWATINIDFHNGTDWKVTVSELYDESRRTSIQPVSRCGVEPLVTDSVDLSVHPYLTMQFSGSIPSLDPKRMTLGGCIGVRDYPALAKSDMHGRFDGELRLSGTIARPEVSGKLTAIEAVIAPDFAEKAVRPLDPPLDVTLVRGPPVPPATRPERNPFKTNVVLGIVVAIPKNSVRVEPLFRLPFGEVRALLYPSGDLNIRTAYGELGIEGTIVVPRETVTIYGKTFTVDNDSRLTFVGNMVNDPQILFTARHNIAEVDLSSIGLTTTKDSEVVVRVTGTPVEPRLKFSSTPSMDETNILSVIALGVPAGGGEAVGEAVQAQLLTAVMGMATLQFARDFKQRLALDVLRIEARSSDPSESRVTAGKRLAENLILSYYLDLGAEEDEDLNSATLEYRITRFLAILARAGDSGDVGFELNLRFQDR